MAGSVGATTAPIRSPVDNGTSKTTAATTPVDERGDDDAGHGEQPDSDGDPAEDSDRELQPAEEEDERDPERQEELGARRVERHVDRVGDGRPEQRSDRAGARASAELARASATTWQTRPATSMTPSVRMMSFVDTAPILFHADVGRAATVA